MAVDDKDYYKILGVNKNANKRDIQKAYRKLAREFHPDVNPGNKAAEEKFKDINEANEVLSDPEKRERYDELSSYRQQYERWPDSAGAAGRASGRDGRRAGPSPYQYSTMSEEDLNDLFGGASPFSDFFETFFGAGRSGTTGKRGSTAGRTQYDAYTPPARQDSEAQIDVTLADAYRGSTRVLEVSEPGGQTRRLEVKIPPGVDEGSRIRISGQGSAGQGDLYLRVHLISDPRFTRSGTTLRTRVDVPLTTAILGGEVHVPTPDGRRLALHIPAGTANGKVFRLHGQGMPTLEQPDKRGDLYAEVNVVLPTHLNAEQRHRFEAFARSIDNTTHATRTEQK